MSEWIVKPIFNEDGFLIGYEKTGEVVRCRDCKYWNEEDHWCNIRDSYGWDYKPDDFCSYGDRKDEPQTERSE